MVLYTVYVRKSLDNISGPDILSLHSLQSVWAKLGKHLNENDFFSPISLPLTITKSAD